MSPTSYLLLQDAGVQSSRFVAVLNSSCKSVDERWKAWWVRLSKMCTLLPDEHDTGRQLSLATIHPGAHVGSPSAAPNFPNNISKSCILCGEDHREDFNHLLVECEISRAIWQTLSGSTTDPPGLEQFICPSPLPSTSTLASRLIYTHVIWKLSRSRRFSGALVTPAVNHRRLYLRAEEEAQALLI